MSPPQTTDADLFEDFFDIKTSRRNVLRRATTGVSLLAGSAVPFCLWPLVTSAQALHAADSRRLPFTVFDEMSFKRKPSLRHSGLQDIHVAYAGQLWPEMRVEEEPNLDFLVDDYFVKTKPPGNKMVCIDIEHWSLRDRDERVVAESMGKLLIILKAFRTAWPGTEIGFFEVGPQSIGPIRAKLASGEMTQMDWRFWETMNDRLKPITDEIDIFFPAVYSEWPNSPVGWERFARADIGMARRYANGKPVIPFVWPQFWSPGNALIPGPYWRSILDTVYEIADSAVIWSIYSNAPKWDPRSPWWHETVDFLRVNNLTPTVTDRNSL